MVTVTRLSLNKFYTQLPLLSMFLVFFAAIGIMPLPAKGNEIQQVPTGYTGIYSAADMEEMRSNLSGKFILMNDIDLAPESTATGGWKPIGNERIPFTGAFDGNGNKITGVNIHFQSVNSINTGLFGYTQNAQLSNIRIEESSIKAETTGAQADVRAGGIVGHAVSTWIYNVYYSGSVKGESPFGAYIGGIAGTMDGRSSYVGQSRNEGTILAEAGSPRAGGIAGALDSAESYGNENSGEVVAHNNGSTGVPHGEAGGIAGSVNNTSISQNGNFGNVNSSEYAGGLVGFATEAPIYSSFNSGSVAGTSYTGGIGAFVSDHSPINQTYNTGSVTSDTAGGLFGFLGDNSSLYNTYNAGNVNDGNASGGLVYSTGYRTTIESSYNVGKSQFGLVAEAQYPVTINYGYHNNETSAVGSGKWNGNVKYLDSDAMVKEESFQDFSFDYGWTMKGNPDYPYPELQGNPAVSSGDLQTVKLGSTPRVVYLQGEPFDPASGSLIVKQAGGKEISVPITNEMVTSFDSSKVGPQVATISYNGWQVDINVDVKESFLITFVDYDGTEITTERATFSKAAVAPTLPERKGYVFTGWDRDYLHPTEDLTVYAKYDRIHTVVFMLEDGTIIDKQVVKDGATAVVPAIPEKEGYLSEWMGLEGPVTSDLTVTAYYWKKEYRVVFKDQVNRILSTQYVPHGEAATPPTNYNVPYEYVQTGWDQDITHVTSNLTVFPVFELKEFTITYRDQDDNGTVLGTEKVKYGSSATGPGTTPSREGYEFTGWSPASLYNRVSNDGILTAQYQIKTYKVTFMQDGKIISSQTIKHGAPATPPSVNMTGKTGFIFTGWDQDLRSITSDMTVNAKFAIKQYGVTFKSDTGTTLSSQKIDHGKTAIFPKTPVKTGYTFVGWFMSTSDTVPFQVKNPITANTVLYARFAKNTTTPTSVKAASSGYTSVKVSWGKVSGAQYYQVYRSTSKTGSYLYVATVSGNSSSYTNTRLTNGKTYYYKVRAYRVVNGTNVYSGYSGVVSAKPVLATPTGIKASKVSTTSTKISWSRVSEASGYEVFRASSSKGSFVKVGTVSGSTLSYTNKTLKKGKTYYYKVRAYKTVSGKKFYSSYSSYVYRKAI